jgi:hypothetical protein
LLPDGSVLTINGAWGPSYTSGDGSERYLPPPVGAWVPAGATCANLFQHNSYTGEIGPAILRPDGTVFATGSSPYTWVPAHTCIYHASPSDPDYLAWTSGPDFPYDSSGNGLGMADGPAILLPNGNVLVAASPGFYTAPTSFYEFDLTNNWNLVLAPGNVSSLKSDSSDNVRMLLLPTGQVLFMDGGTDVEIYTPANQNYPLSWRPYLGGCAQALDCFVEEPISQTETTTSPGKRLNGLSQANAFGDEFQSATNYPLLRITNVPGTPGQQPEVYYCRTHNYSSMGVATGDLWVSMQYSCPNVPVGFSGYLEVVANGIPSVRNWWVWIIP